MKDQLKELLNEGVVNVTFTKVDGTERTMPCTLNPALIPAEHAPKSPTDAQKQRSEAAQPVYVTDAKGWRSFRWDSVQSFEIVN